MTVDVNWLAVLVSGIVSMILGFLWYGPIFGKQWIGLMGWTDEQMQAAKAKGMTKSYVIMFVSALLTPWVLSYIIAYSSNFTGMTGVSVGLSSGFWAWLGFIVPVSLGPVLWEGKSWKLWFLNVGYYLVLFLIIGAILATWR